MVYLKTAQQNTFRCLGEKVKVMEWKCNSIRMDVATCMNMAANGSTNKINDKTFY